MEGLALNVSSSGTLTGCYVNEIKNVRHPVKVRGGASLACFSSPIQTRAKYSRSQCAVILAGPAGKRRKAQLSASREQTMPLTTFTDKHGTQYPLSQFLQQPAGMKSMLHTSYLQDFEYLGENVFRCYLPEISVLGREVTPVMDLLVYATEAECVVEMIACKFEGPDASEDKVERLSANMKNHLQWQQGENGELLLRTNLNIDVSIEVHHLPFTMLPLSAVETPGNAVLQAIVDRMVPVYMKQLLDDYYNWADDKPEDQTVSLFQQF